MSAQCKLSCHQPRTPVCAAAASVLSDWLTLTACDMQQYARWPPPCACARVTCCACCHPTVGLHSTSESSGGRVTAAVASCHIEQGIPFQRHTPAYARWRLQASAVVETSSNWWCLKSQKITHYQRSS